MILHLRYRSVCRYAHSGRSFFLLPFPRICCQHVRCLFSMGYNTTAAACPCSHPVKTRTVSRHFHTISHHFSTYNQQFYQNMYCFLLSFHKIHVSFLSCYVRLPKNLAENGSQKGFTIFPPDAMLFENDPENQSTNRKDIYYVNWKNDYFGSNRRNRRIQGGEPCQPFKETARGCTRDYDQKCAGIYHTADL